MFDQSVLYFLHTGKQISIFVMQICPEKGDCGKVGFSHLAHVTLSILIFHHRQKELSCTTGECGSLEGSSSVEQSFKSS